jgi:hypothetical protein
MVGYTEAGIALLLSGLLILYVRRLRTRSRFQKRVLIFAMALLVAAVLSNLIISSVVMAPNPETLLVYSKKLQALFDHLLGLSIGVFVMAVVTPGITSGKDLWRHLRETLPVSYVIFNGIFVAGIVGVLIAPVSAQVLPSGGFTFTFPPWFLLMLFLVSANFIFFVTYKLTAYLRDVGSTQPLAQQTYIMLIGLNGYTVGELVFEIILPSMQVDVRGLGFVVEVFLIGLVAFALRERGFLQSFLVPKPEAYRETEKKFHLAPGSSYLVVEEKPDHAFDIFTDMVTHGAEGLCVTRRAPRKVALEHGLERTPILWLSRVVNQENCLRPSPPENVALAIEHFVTAGEQAVVLLDGLEYLIAHNDFGSILTLLHDINESIALHDSILILPLDPKTVGEQQFALIKRELETIQPPAVRDTTEMEEELFLSIQQKPKEAETGF